MSFSVNTITSERKEMTTEEVTLTITNVGIQRRRSVTIPKVVVKKKYHANRGSNPMKSLAGTISALLHLKLHQKK